MALDAKRGTLKWHFQYTPHDIWDFDAQQTPALVDMTWRGTPRKLLVHANRNGFLYVLDRTNGKFLSGTPFVKNITWATGLTPEGRPIVAPNQDATLEGRRICPHVNGATNWYSTSFNPATGLYYILDQRVVRHRDEDADRVGSREGVHGRIVPDGGG